MQAHRLPAALRPLAVLLACLALAGVSLAAAGGGGAAGPPGPRVAAAARAHLHEGYAWGATGPSSWDCSGLTSTLWREVGGVKGIPRTAADQQAWAVPLPAEQALAGDLVFFGDPVTHVGIVQGRTTTGAGTTVRMVDASASRKGVAERDVWTTDLVRFGRVPRPGMPAVAPWTPPVPRPAPTPVAGPPTAVTAHALNGLPPLRGFAATPAVSHPTVATRAVSLARGWLGNTTIADTELVRTVWRRAGGAVLPTTRDGIAAAGRRVAVRDARVGDLVLYGPPTAHIGIYAGNGLMVDASRLLGRVVLRQVWASPTVRIFRLAR